MSLKHVAGPARQVLRRPCPALARCLRAPTPRVPRETQAQTPHAHFSFSSENCFSRSSISLTHSLRRRS